MYHATPILDERETVTAASRLIMGPINRNASIVAEQQGANRTVADEEHVACSITCQDVFDLTDDAQLGIDCSFPSLYADSRLREKLIGHRLKLVGWQEACRCSVVLVHRLSDFDGDV